MAQLEWFTTARHRYVVFEGQCITFTAFCRRFKLTQSWILKRMIEGADFDTMVRDAIMRKQARTSAARPSLPTDDEIRTVFFWSKPIEEIK